VCKAFNREALLLEFPLTWPQRKWLFKTGEPHALAQIDGGFFRLFYRFSARATRLCLFNRLFEAGKDKLRATIYWNVTGIIIDVPIQFHTLAPRKERQNYKMTCEHSEDFWRSCDHASLMYSFKCNQEDATFYNILYYCLCSTCFGRFLRPSSGT